MKKGIIIDANDLKKIIAKYFNVDESNVIKSQYSWTVVTDDEETEKEIVNNAVLEARLLCKKIKELKEQGFTYREMAVLMRSPSNVAPVYEKEMIEQNIPVFTDTSSEYLESIEIDTIISLLKINHL